MNRPPPPCPGPLIWYDVEGTLCSCHGHTAAILECACCGYIVVSGNYHDAAHSGTEMMREGMAN